MGCRCPRAGIVMRGSWRSEESTLILVVTRVARILVVVVQAGSIQTVIRTTVTVGSTIPVLQATTCGPNDTAGTSWHRLLHIHTRPRHRHITPPCRARRIRSHCACQRQHLTARSRLRLRSRRFLLQVATDSGHRGGPVAGGFT